MRPENNHKDTQSDFRAFLGLLCSQWCSGEHQAITHLWPTDSDSKGSAYSRAADLMPQRPLCCREPQSLSPPTLLDPVTLKGTVDVPATVSTRGL